MNRTGVEDTADFPCALLRTTKDGVISWANAYFADHFAWNADQLAGMNVASLFSRASLLFCNSYVYPKAMAEQVCKEVQVTVLTSAGERRPVVASVRSLGDGGFAWVFMEADQRDALFHELEAAREALKDQKAQLEHLSRTDALTGVLNRRGFEEGMARVFAEADRHGQPVSLLMMDIDHFKSINDTHGHEVGDEALVLLGGILGEVCRAQDLVGRFGGDEFVCLLNHTDVAGAQALCRRIHGAVAERGAGLGGFTVSIGVAGRGAHQPLPRATLLSVADKALYDAKERGRNTTVARDADGVSDGS